MKCPFGLVVLHGGDLEGIPPHQNPLSNRLEMEKCHVWCHVSLSIWSFIEVSDQNFVDEELKEKTSCVSGAKRLKMMPMLDASSNSQVRLKILTVSAFYKSLTV
ncbi:hypothetical protein Gogos_017374 [Gossypium gossypioides]|uniref:Uncharacterized protein n=1 Tax=Gossypium gossypioides TaxID=34282 RepID=A0A7J9BAJ4_GOSGO|nr:hypothetical protein [Gossypium gossypioides]